MRIVLEITAGLVHAIGLDQADAKPGIEGRVEWEL